MTEQKNFYKLKNLPKFLNYATLRQKLMKHFNVKRPDISLIYKDKGDYAYLEFKTDTFDKLSLENFLISNRKITIIETEPKEPKKLIRPAKTFIKPENFDIRDIVTPYHRIQYEQQVEKKFNELKKFCSKIEQIKNFEFVEAKSFTRNNFQLTFGKDGNKNCVGFRAGKFVENGNSVFFNEEIKFLPEVLTEKIKKLEILINDEEVLGPQMKKDLVYDRDTKEGFLKLIMLRIDNEGNILCLLLLANSGKFGPFRKIEEVFDTFPFDNVSYAFEDSTFEGFQKIQEKDIINVKGGSSIRYNLCGFKFEVSFFSFFQTNTENFELILDYINPSNKVLADVCCGSGVIGICLSKLVEKVVGVEISEASYKDFLVNRKINDITNYDFICDDVKNFSFSLHGGNRDMSVVLDPPRAGVNKSVIQKIRGVSEINEIFFISCDYKKGLANVEDFIKEESKRYKNSPFYVEKVVGFDLFPNTDKMEVLFVLKR